MRPLPVGKHTSIEELNYELLNIKQYYFNNKLARSCRIIKLMSEINQMGVYVLCTVLLTDETYVMS